MQAVKKPEINKSNINPLKSIRSNFFNRVKQLPRRTLFIILTSILIVIVSVSGIFVINALRKRGADRGYTADTSVDYNESTSITESETTSETNEDVILTATDEPIQETTPQPTDEKEQEAEKTTINPIPYNDLYKGIDIYAISYILQNKEPDNNDYFIVEDFLSMFSYVNMFGSYAYNMYDINTLVMFAYQNTVINDSIEYDFGFALNENDVYEILYYYFGLSELQVSTAVEYMKTGYDFISYENDYFLCDYFDGEAYDITSVQTLNYNDEILDDHLFFMTEGMFPNIPSKKFCIIDLNTNELTTPTTIRKPARIKNEIRQPLPIPLLF